MVNFSVWGAELPGIARFFKARKSQAQTDITFFDVKELYNRAYEHRAFARSAVREYRQINARARAMDAAYRAQLGQARKAA